MVHQAWVVPLQVVPVWAEPALVAACWEGQAGKQAASMPQLTLTPALPPMAGSTMHNLTNLIRR